MKSDLNYIKKLIKLLNSNNVSEIEVEGTPVSPPAASAAHREQSLGQIDLDSPARAATVMSMSHAFSPLMCLRYILATSQASLDVHFFGLTLW